MQRQDDIQVATVSRPVLFIGISGGTCSGKSVLAGYLHRLLGEDITNVISHDDYYRGWSHLSPEERANLNFDHPDALDTALLVEHINMLKSGREVWIPIYDFKNHTRSHEYRYVVPKPFNIVDGILIFQNPDLREALDLRVYLEVSFGTILRRRLDRDVRERGRTTDFVKDQLISTVYPMHMKYVEPFKKYAHMIIEEGTALTERASLVMGGIRNTSHTPVGETACIRSTLL